MRRRMRAMSMGMALLSRHRSFHPLDIRILLDGIFSVWVSRGNDKKGSSLTCIFIFASLLSSF